MYRFFIYLVVYAVGVPLGSCAVAALTTEFKA
jgi:hypothetical protein